MKTATIKKHISSVLSSAKSQAEKIDIMNELREHIHLSGPFKNEPVDYVAWVKNELVHANDYNPNKVAPPEMELLEVSIVNDGYTQPIVSFPNDGKYEVVDGFHRNRVGKESRLVNARVNGYLPVVGIRKEKQGKTERIASTIRHNRARGKHQVDAMSEIVLELKSRNWQNRRIARELGMDEEEILRLCQISGLRDIFKDSDFSKSWIAGESAEEYEPITDDVSLEVRTANTNDPQRIFHTHEKWECQKAGFYASKKEGMTPAQCEHAYAEFLSDEQRFKDGLKGVLSEWKHSCEHYLTNRAMNRIAWLGQAAMCYSTGVPSKFCSGFSLLPIKKQEAANKIALIYLNEWLMDNQREGVEMEEALSAGRQVEIY